MSSYPPPTQNVSIFDEINFRSGEQTLTQAEADKRYLRYPNAQGTETLQDINVNGVATFSNTITAPGDLTLDPVGSITCNGKTIDLTGGEIHNCPLVHSQNNNDIFIEGKGTGSIGLKTSNTNRLIIFDSGFISFEGGGSYNNATNTFTATTFSGSATAVTTVSDNTSGTYYIPFTKTTAGTGKTLFIDDTTGPLSYNPSTGAFNVGTTLKLGPAATGVVGLGSGAGQNSQSNTAVAIGSLAGNQTQGSSAVAIGNNSGRYTQSQNGVAIGNSAGQGVSAGVGSQGSESVAIGNAAGRQYQGPNCIAIGNSAGIGTAVVGTGQAADAIAIGTSAGATSQGVNTIAIGYLAGSATQGQDSVAIGSNAGNNLQATGSVAIGYFAGYFVQGSKAIAIGYDAGRGQVSGQGAGNIAIGNQAQRNRAGGTDCIAIGTNAGQGTSSGQGNNSIAIGNNAHATRGVGTDCIAIGTNAGQGTTTGQGDDAIAIGRNAGVASQNANSICLNASGVALNPNQPGLFIDPVRNATQTTIVGYDTTSKELTYYSGVSTVAVTDTNTSATYYPTFVDAAGASQTLRADIGTTPFTYNPNTQILTAGIFSGYPSIPDVSTQATFTAGVLDGTGAGSARSFYGWWYSMTGTTNTITNITVTGAIANGYYYFVVTNNGSGNLTVNTMTKGSWAANLTIAAGKKVVFQCCMLRDGAASVSLYVNAFVFPI